MAGAAVALAVELLPDMALDAIMKFAHVRRVTFVLWMTTETSPK